jgi:hypothetical protein
MRARRVGPRGMESASGRQLAECLLSRRPKAFVPEAFGAEHSLRAGPVRRAERAGIQTCRAKRQQLHVEPSQVPGFVFGNAAVMLPDGCPLVVQVPSVAERVRLASGAAASDPACL